jgi:phage terminase large subunit-like protein
MVEKIKSDLDIAVAQGKVNDVLVKNMNMFTQASENSYISADDWERAKMRRPNLKNRDVYFGIDLSKSNDLTSVSWLIPTGNGSFYCDSHSWVATKYGLDSKIKRDGIDYVSMEKAGECTITRLDSGIIDYDSLVEYVQNLIGKYNWTVKAIAYDPYNAQTVITKFEKLNYPLFEVRQGTKTLNIPTRNFRDLLFDGKIKHNGNKILAYAVNNAVIKVLNNGWQLDKDKNSNRIDPIAALINSYVAAMNYYQDEEEKQAKNEYYEKATNIF